MRKLTFLLFFFSCSYQVYAFQADSSKVDETILLFVRHAERAEDGTRNPPISEIGIERAENLAQVLIEANYKLTAIYSTPYKRTQMTSQPTADLFELEVIEYGFDDLENWLSTIIETNKGNAVLIVGHSNTTPRLVNMVLGEESFEQLDEHAYGDLFIVSTKSYGTGNVGVSSF